MMILNRALPTFVALLFASCMLSPLVARADTFDFTITSTGTTLTGDNPNLALSGSGTLTTTTDPNQPGVQDVTSLTGMLTNGGLTGDNNPVSISLIPDSQGVPYEAGYQLTFYTQNNGQFYLDYDNVIDPSASDPLDGYGLAFESSDGISYVVGTDPGYGTAYEAYNDQIGFDQLTFNDNNALVDLSLTSVTPEPSSIALLGTGLLGVAGLLRRRVGRRS